MHSWLCRHLGARTASTLPRTSFAGLFHHSLTWQHHYAECNPKETEDQRSLVTLLQGLSLTAFLLRGGTAAGGLRPH